VSPRLGVLTSRYPAPSHTFIRRQVEALRRRGAEVDTFSVRRPEPGEVQSDEDRQAEAETWYLLPVSPLRLVGLHLRALARAPRRYAETLGVALREGVPGLRGSLWAVFHFGEAVVLAAELDRRGLRHLHSHFANSAATVGLLACRFLGIDWSLTLHGTADFDTPWSPSLVSRLHHARFVACVSDYGRAQAMRALDPEEWHRTFVSRCGIDVEGASLPERTGRSPGPLRLLSVGRLSPEKGQMGLLEAVESLISRGVEAELRVVGEGPERRRLAGRIETSPVLKTRVLLLGALPEAGVLQELEQAELFVLSSLMEGLPVVLMEAMMTGVPVVAPRVAGIPELVEDGRTGLLFTPARWDELAHAMERLHRDPGLRGSLVDRAREKVEREFRLDRAIEPLWRRLVDACG